MNEIEQIINRVNTFYNFQTKRPQLVCNFVYIESIVFFNDHSAFSSLFMLPTEIKNGEYANEMIKVYGL